MQTTTNGLRYPDAGDPATTWQYWQNLAEDTDQYVQDALISTLGDSSNSLTLTSTVDMVQTARSTILTQTFSLSQDQHVTLGGKALFRAQSSSIGSGLIGLTLVVDGTDTDQAGPILIGAYNSATDHGQLSIASIPYLLNAGSHTVSLVGDRDINGLINAIGNNTELAHNYHSTRLTIIT